MPISFAYAILKQINVSQMNIISRFHDDFQRAASIFAPTRHRHREVDIKPIHQEVDVTPFHDDHRVLGKGNKKDDDSNLFVTGIRGKSPKSCNKNVKNLQKELQECEDKLRTSRTTDDLAKCHEDLDRVHEDLDTCQEDLEDKGAQVLFTQMANQCTFNRKWKGGEYEYTFSSYDMDDQTYAFEEIPNRGASVMATTEFFDLFYANFGNKKPNGAMTFDDVSSQTSERPIIAAFVSAAYYTVSVLYIILYPHIYIFRLTFIHLNFKYRIPFLQHSHMYWNNSVIKPRHLCHWMNFSRLKTLSLSPMTSALSSSTV